MVECWKEETHVEKSRKRQQTNADDEQFDSFDEFHVLTNRNSKFFEFFQHLCSNQITIRGALLGTGQLLEQSIKNVKLGMMKVRS